MERGKKLVLLFSISGIAILLFFTGLLAYRNKLFVGKSNYYTLIEDAHGLSALPWVYYKGFEVGRVTNFDLSKDNRIEVKFYIYNEFTERLRKYSVLVVNRNPLTNDVSEFKLIIPEEGDSPELLPEDELIPDWSSRTGKDYLTKGKTVVDEDGVAGVLAKTNEILQLFIDEKTNEKIHEIIVTTGKILENADKAIISFDPASGSYQGNQIQALMEKANGSMEHLLQSMGYIKETLEVLHRSRTSIAPLLMNTNKTMERAQDTLEGINNNPLLKGGINKEKKYRGVEIVQ